MEKQLFIWFAEIFMKKSAEFKIDLEAKDNNGKTAIYLAMKNGYKEISKMLMQKLLKKLKSCPTSMILTES